MSFTFLALSLLYVGCLENIQLVYFLDLKAFYEMDYLIYTYIVEYDA